MSRRLTAKNLVTLVVLLVLVGVPTSSLAYFHLPGNHSLNPALIKQPSTGPDPQLGFDCGLGTTQAVVNGTGFPVANSETGVFEILPSCTWVGDVSLSVPGAASDGTTEPLVTDQDETFNPVSTAIGGGFTADAVYLQTATSVTNGFDLTINWDPKVIHFVQFDQSGLPWNTNNPFTGVFTLDNSVGQLHVVQVIFSALGGDFVFFRLRFDVVGVGSSGLTITKDVITNPGAVVHQTFNGAFDAESFFDPAHTLNWVASFTNSTPILPGSANNFQATVTGGTGPYTYAWDVNSDGTTDSTTNPASLTIPTSTLTGHRIQLVVTDSASQVVSLAQRLPLKLNVQGPQGLTTTSVGTANTFIGDWLGGIPPYTGSWRFCPGGIAASVDCNRPAPTIASTSGQVNSQTGTTAITYARAGVYTSTLKITDAGSPVIPGGGTSVIFTYLVNVTGAPQAYTISLSVNPTTTTVGQTVQYTATSAYSAGYTVSLRSSTISVKFAFGDGSTATSVITMATGGANTTSVSHTYLAANASPGYTVLAVGQETASNAVSLIQEVSNRITETVNKRSTSTTVSCSPGTVPVGTASACTAAVADSSPGTAATPGGTVSFASDGVGSFDSPSCTLVAGTTGPPTCTVNYTPTAAGSGTHTITGTYSGDLTHATSQGTGTVLVSGGAPTVTVNSPTPNPANTGATVTVTFTVTSSVTVTGITVNWGDGTAPDSLAGTATSDTHVYTSTGSAKSQVFTITVTATNSAGPGSGTTTETVNDRPPVVTIPNVSPNPADTGATVTVTFTATDPDGTIASISVNWGDGTAPDSLAGTTTSDTHIYANTGSAKSQVFTITVTATDNSGSTGSATSSETINDRPPVVIVTNVSPNPVNTGQLVSISFTTTDPDGTVSSITVNWGDSSPLDNLAGTATTDTHTYPSAGSFTITVAATDNSGSTGQTTGSITVNAVGVPTVTVNSPTPNPANTGQTVTVTFTVSSTVTVTGITVNWGDGTAPDSLAGTATSDTHVYTSTGNLKSQTFAITVTATNSAGPGSATTTEVVNDLPATVTISAVLPNPADTGQTVTVTFSAMDPDGTITSISVNWGDGSPVDTLAGLATSDTHSYSSTGSSTTQAFTITVTATDNSGSTGSATTSETVNDRPPIVSVTNVSPNPANTGQLVTTTFTATDPDGTISSITVNWGDGTAPDTLAGTATGDSHTYSSAGSFTITVTATDNSGSTGQGTGSITVNVVVGVPTVTVNAPTPNPADTGATVTVTFTVTSTATVTGITVNWGDGTAPDSLPGTATSDTHVYTSTISTSQSFTITVTATNSAGSGSGTTTEVVNDLPPVVTITSITPPSPFVGQSVTVSFTATDPDGTVSSISVNWGDGTALDSLPGTATSDTHVYSVGGTFAVIITATDNSGSMGQTTGSITVTVPVGVPSVTVNSPTPNPAITGQMVTVTFTVSSTDTVTGIMVNWGDGTTPDTLSGTATSDTHVYASTGTSTSETFTITVTATNSAGPGSGTTTETVNDRPPVASFTFNPTSPSSGQTVSFDASASADPDGTIVSYAWDFGDGTTGTDVTPTHVYSPATTTTFIVMLTVTDNLGSTGSKSQSITVTVTAVNPPVVTITGVVPNPANTGQTVSLTFTVSSTATVTGITVDWGDGTTPDSLPGTAVSDTHAYTSAGIFTIMVTATNSAGSGSATTTETISPAALSVDFSFTPTSPTTGQSVSFTSIVSGGTAPYTYAWNFGDGTTSTSANPTHTYSTASSFAVNLTVTDASTPSLTRSASHTVVVTLPSGNPDFAISARSTSLTVGGESSLCEGASTLCDDEVSTRISVTSLNGFKGAVHFVTSSSGGGDVLTVYCRPRTILVMPGGTSTANCTIEAEINPDTPTTFTVTIKGVNGTLSHSVTLTVVVTHNPVESDPPQLATSQVTPTTAITSSTHVSHSRNHAQIFHKILHDED